MKKKIFSIAAVVLFASASLSANQNTKEDMIIAYDCIDAADELWIEYTDEHPDADFWEGFSVWEDFMEDCEDNE